MSDWLKTTTPQPKKVKKMMVGRMVQASSSRADPGCAVSSRSWLRGGTSRKVEHAKYTSPPAIPQVTVMYQNSASNRHESVAPRSGMKGSIFTLSLPTASRRANEAKVGAADRAARPGGRAGEPGRRPNQPEATSQCRHCTTRKTLTV